MSTYPVLGSKTVRTIVKSTTNVSQALKLKANLNKCFEGAKPNAKGFLVPEEKIKQWLKADPGNQAVLKSFLDAGDLVDIPNGSPSRWIIDFDNRSLEEASDYKMPFEHTKVTVKPERENSREPVLREKWWRFKRTHAAMRHALAPLKTYLVVPAHSKWFIFLPADSNWLPGNSTKVVASDDFYILGILTSNVHRTWVKAQSSTLKGDTRYTHNTCFETFPFPQTPTPKLIEQIRSIALELHEYRSQQMEKKQWGITKLYNEYFAETTSQLHKLHAKLDRLVLQAYSFNPDDDLLEKLLTLNLELAAKEKSGEAIVGCWAPEQ